MCGLVSSIIAFLDVPLAFQSIYGRVSRGMMHSDKMMLAILLLRIFVKGTGEKTYDAQWDLLLGK